MRMKMMFASSDTKKPPQARKDTHDIFSESDCLYFVYA
jgi:hypothetical protein